VLSSLFRAQYYAYSFISGMDPICSNNNRRLICVERRSKGEHSE
jgi:hypothetical protein